VISRTGDHVISTAGTAAPTWASSTLTPAIRRKVLLPAAFGPVMTHVLWSGGQVQIIGHGVLRCQERMAAVPDRDARPAVAAVTGDRFVRTEAGQTVQGLQFGHGRQAGQQSVRLGCHMPQHRFGDVQVRKMKTSSRPRAIPCRPAHSNPRTRRGCGIRDNLSESAFQEAQLRLFGQLCVRVPGGRQEAVQGGPLICPR